MNGKIEGTPPQSLRSATAAAAAPKGTTAKSGGTAPASTGPIPAVPAADSVELSGEAAGLVSLQKSLAEAPVADTARIAAVRAALDSGTYRIDPQAIAARLAQLERELGG